MLEANIQLSSLGPAFVDYNKKNTEINELNRNRYT